MSYYSSGLAQLVQKISWSKYVDGIVLFNRFYNPDIDINKMKITSSDVFSTPDEISKSLRWIALMSDKVTCDLAASTGVHDGSGVIVSSIYKNGNTQINTVLKELENWMSEKNYNSLEEFRGLMSYKNVKNPAVYERIQFMKYYGGVE